MSETEDTNETEETSYDISDIPEGCQRWLQMFDSDSDDGLGPNIDAVEEHCYAEYVEFIKYIIPQLEGLDEFIDALRTMRDGPNECTFLRTLDGMERKLKFFQTTDEDMEKFLHSLLALSKKESLRIMKALNNIDLIRQKRLLLLAGMETVTHTGYNFHDYIREIGRSAPLWMGQTNEIAPPLCGAIPPPDDFEFEVGHLVAAFVVADFTETVHDEIGVIGKWILAIVNDIDEGNYDIKDMDGSGSLYTVLKRKLIPLPLYVADPENNPEAIFPKDSLVLALYRNTTCFFPGIVTRPPLDKNDDYKILFRDGNEWGAKIKVEQQFVIGYQDAYAIITKEEKEYLISNCGIEAIRPIKQVRSDVSDDDESCGK